MVKQEALQKQSEGIEKFFKFNIMSPSSMVKDFNLEFKLPDGGIGDMYAIKGMTHTDNITSTDPRIKNLVEVESIDKDNLSTIYLPDDGAFRAREKLNKDRDIESFDIYGSVDDLLSSDTYDVDIRQNFDAITTDLYSGVPEDEYKPGEGALTVDSDPVKFNNNELQKNGFTVVSSLKEYFETSVMDDIKTEQTVLMPYTLDLTIYGISSIVPGDTFTVDYLPKAHLENTFLQVTKVAQNVDSTGWYTSLQTQYRPFYPEKKDNIFSTNITNTKRKTRLSPTCLISEFKIKTNSKMGNDVQPLVNTNWNNKGKASKNDDALDLQEFFKYITDVQYEIQPEDSRIDHILHFKTSSNIMEKFAEKVDNWKNGDFLIHNHNIRTLSLPSPNNRSTNEDWLKNKGFVYEENTAGTDKWRNMWEGDYKPDLLWKYVGHKKQTDTGGTLVKFRYKLPSFRLEQKMYYRMWIKNGNVAILKPNRYRYWYDVNLLNEEDERYKKLKKLFQKNVYANQNEWKF